MATNERYVSTNADLKVARSRFPLNRRTVFSYFHGYLHNVGTPIEVLPGDTLKAKLSVFTRMSTPIFPFIDNVRQEYDFWFVPKRILWNKTKQFYGEAPSFGIAAKVYEPHRAELAEPISHFLTNEEKSETFAITYGLIENSGAVGTPTMPINVLPIRALLAVWNEFYRDENYQDQYTWDKDATGHVSEIGYLGLTKITSKSFLPKVNKDRDVISSILPWAQKGDPVSIGLTGSVPLTRGSLYTMFDADALGQDGLVLGTVRIDDSNNMPVGYGANVAGSTTGDIKSNVYAKLSDATAVKINDLLYALAYQDFLARSAHFGTRYKEYIYSMFGTRIPDLSDDVPEYLGRLKFNINVQQVVQTTGFVASSSTELGALGAYSNSGRTGEVFNKSFTEPGYLVLVTYTKHQRTYSSGTDRVMLKTELLDYYQPPFAHIPDLPIGSGDVWINLNAETSLGFQEPHYDYRALQDRAYGLMNPMVDTLGELWTLAEKWTSKPTINGAFMVEDRACIARVLATGLNGPDYICDALLELDATRVMPLYSSGRLEKF